MKALNSEIKDLQQEFELDRADYLETIGAQEQKTKLLEQILEKVQPTIRKDCNYTSVSYVAILWVKIMFDHAPVCFYSRNLQKIMNEAVWSNENQVWRIPDLVMQKTKLPPAGKQLLNRALTVPVTYL